MILRQTLWIGFNAVFFQFVPAVSTKAEAAGVGKAASWANQHQARPTHATKPGVWSAAKSAIGAQHDSVKLHGIQQKSEPPGHFYQNADRHIVIFFQ
jgi:hypothetical protein